MERSSKFNGDIIDTYRQCLRPTLPMLENFNGDAVDICWSSIFKEIEILKEQITMGLVVSQEIANSVIKPESNSIELLISLMTNLYICTIDLQHGYNLYIKLYLFREFLILCQNNRSLILDTKYREKSCRANVGRSSHRLYNIMYWLSQEYKRK